MGISPDRGRGWWCSEYLDTEISVALYCRPAVQPFMRVTGNFLFGRCVTECKPERISQCSSLLHPGNLQSKHVLDRKIETFYCFLLLHYVIIRSLPTWFALCTPKEDGKPITAILPPQEIQIYLFWSCRWFFLENHMRYSRVYTKKLCFLIFSSISLPPRTHSALT